MPENKTVFLVKGISGKFVIYDNIVSVFTEAPKHVTNDPVDEFHVTSVYETTDQPNLPGKRRLTVNYSYLYGDHELRSSMFIEQIEVKS